VSQVLLDTHVWIWWSIEDMTSLSQRARKTIQGAQKKWIAAISCWELAKLVEKQRLGLKIPTLEWIRRSLHESDLRIADLTPEIAVESTQFQGFHADPADQLIVATARLAGLPLVTADQRIMQSRLVEVVW